MRDAFAEPSYIATASWTNSWRISGSFWDVRKDGCCNQKSNMSGCHSKTQSKHTPRMRIETWDGSMAVLTWGSWIGRSSSQEHYHKTGWAQYIAKSYWFEHGTMPLWLHPVSPQGGSTLVATCHKRAAIRQAGDSAELRLVRH